MPDNLAPVDVNKCLYFVESWISLKVDEIIPKLLLPVDVRDWLTHNFGILVDDLTEK